MSDIIITCGRSNNSNKLVNEYYPIQLHFTGRKDVINFLSPTIDEHMGYEPAEWNNIPMPERAATNKLSPVRIAASGEPAVVTGSPITTAITVYARNADALRPVIEDAYAFAEHGNYSVNTPKQVLLRDIATVVSASQQQKG